MCLVWIVFPCFICFDVVCLFVCVLCLIASPPSYVFWCWFVFWIVFPLFVVLLLLVFVFVDLRFPPLYLFWCCLFSLRFFRLVFPVLRTLMLFVVFCSFNCLLPSFMFCFNVVGLVFMLNCLPRFICLMCLFVCVF